VQNLIKIKGAREHNLKNINLELPRDKLIVITGLSGSGKSTLAFDTIYAEGQRRYVESLSAYARQFLGLMNKPDIDLIEGLSPAISIEQKTTSKNPRSTVGTVTEIYDYLRLLFARVGTPFCPIHGEKIQKQSPTNITNQIIQQFLGKEVYILAPIIRDKKGTYETLIADLNKDGYEYVFVNEKLIRTTDKVNLERYKKHNIEIVLDKLIIKKTDSQRIQEAVENSLKQAEGLVSVILVTANSKQKAEQKIKSKNQKAETDEQKAETAQQNAASSEQKKAVLFSSTMACPKCGLIFEELQPRMFSFNTPYGACEECSGIGYKQEVSKELVVPDMTQSLMDNAIKVYSKLMEGWRLQQLKAVGDKFGFDLYTPLNKFTKKQLDVLLYGSKEPFKAQWDSGAFMNMENGWEGVIPQTERLYKQTESEYRRKEIEKFMSTSPCTKCNGKRLKEKVLAVKINDKSIIEITDMSISKALTFFKELNDTLTEEQKFIAKTILKELLSRLHFLDDVGLTYLTLSRSAGTLSGGEAQRIRLATQIGSNLTGVLYVLDEPSIGLHQKDNVKLIGTLKKLRDLGNTLIVVEHDAETMENADYIVDIGPKAGIHGGEVCFVGTPKELLKSKSLTGEYLSKKRKIEYNSARRSPSGWFQILGAKENNLKNINVKIPKSVMTLITGVSGSGKSTLIHQILYNSLMKKIYDSKPIPGLHDEIENIDDFEQVIIIDQSPIGKTPRSNPATYIKVFDLIRDLYAQTGEAKMRGYKQGRFSFNVAGGRCEKCQGDGTIKIEMNFLPDVYVECDECKGKRYNHETLEVTYKGKNISDVLNMSVEEAVTFFENIPSIQKKIKVLNDVGLGYIKLGQSATTLSGGESQRIKLTKELSKRSTKNTIYILDEPTTGLHFHDINNLLNVLNKLVDNGSTMIIIEHNLDIIKNADYIIDLGPDGGDKGGEVVAFGTPEEIVKNNGKKYHSYTADFLKKELEK
jgi:excinuclease ABC subunit A